MSAVTASATVLKIPPAPVPPGAEKSSDDVGGDDGADVGLQAWRGLLRTHALLAKRVEAQLDREHKLPLSSYEVLQRLLDAPAGRMRMCDLAEQVQLSRSGLSRLADRLEREGLLSRCSCEHDARGAYACLTDSGRERLSAARETHRSVVCEHFLSHFSAEELRALAGMWERILPSCCAGE
jgi:DNA-binding MarR family transcriptional regulator